MIAYLPPLPPPNRRVENLVLRVEEASSRYDRGQFLAVARHIYRGDRRWIPPLAALRKRALWPERNPLLAGAELGAWLGIAQNLGLGDEPVGSIAAWSMPVEDEYEEAWSAWGLFESLNINEMAERLFYEAESWLFEHAKGINGIRGPMALEPLAAPGLLTDGFDAETAAFLPYNPPYYPDMVEAQGYEPGMIWRAYVLDLLPSPARAPVPKELQGSNRWREVMTAYSTLEGEPLHRRTATPGLIGWLSQLAGNETRETPTSGRWVLGRVFARAITVVHDPEISGGAACFGIPDFATALRRSRGRMQPLGWLLFEAALLRARRLRVFPAAAPADWNGARVAALYADLAQRAERAGYRQMLIAPISDDDERGREAMNILRARPTQQFTIYEKRF